MAGPLSFWDVKRRFQIEFLINKGLMPYHYLLDLGCGPLRGGVPIIEYLNPFHYYGFDVNPEVVLEAYNEVGENNLKEKYPNILCADYISDASINILFDYVWAFSTLIHMNDDVLNETLQYVKDRMKSNSVFYANLNIDSIKDYGDWHGFPIVTKPLDEYLDIFDRNGFVAKNIGTLKDNGHPDMNISSDDQTILEIRIKNA